MASFFRSGSSRRKAEAPGKIRIQLKGKNSKVLNSEDEDDVVDDNAGAMDGDNGIPEDLPEGTIVVQPVAVEDAPVKKKRDPPVRIDTSVLDSVSCTACGRQLNPYKSGALQKHPELKVVICRRCDKFLNSGDIAKDKDGTDEQCRWCGEGGRLVVCDDCASAFCKTCVMRNFNRSEFNNINSQQKWKCYLCNKAPIQGLRENYKKIKETLKALHQRDKAKSATAAPTSNGTQNSEKSVGSMQISEGSAPVSGQKGKSGLIKSTPSPQTNNVSSASSKLKSNSKASHSEQGKMVEDSTLRLEDIYVSHENVDTVMEKLSTATNTFKEMLRALRSQFHATSPRGSDEAPPIQFSSSSMNDDEKKRRCAKALSMGLETYVKSLKTILSGSGLSGDISLKNDSTTDKVSKPCSKTQDSVAASTTVKAAAKSKDTNVNGVKDSSVTSACLTKQTSSKLSLTSSGEMKGSESSSDDSDDESSEANALDSAKGKSSKVNKESGKVGDTSKLVEKLSNDKTISDESSSDESSSKSASAKDSPRTSRSKEKAKPNAEARDVPDKKSKGASAVKSTTVSESVNSRNSKDNLKSKNDSGDDNVKGRKKDTLVKDSAKTVSKVSVKRSKDSGKDSTKESTQVDKSKQDNDNSKNIHNEDTAEKSGAQLDENDSMDFTGEKSFKSGTNGDGDKSEEEAGDITAAEIQGSNLPKKTQNDNKSSGHSFIADDETDENLAAKFDLIKELADEILDRGLHDDEEDNDDNAVQESDSVEPAGTSEATKDSEDQNDGAQGRPKRKKKDISSDSDDNDNLATKKSKGTKKINKKTVEEKQAKKTSKDDAMSSSDVSSSDLLMSDASDENATAKKQKKKRKEAPKSTESVTNKPAKSKPEPVKKEEKSQANGKPKAKSPTTSVKVNGEKSKAEVDDLDKEIDKLAKMPTMRKRKAGNTEEDKESADKEEVKGKSKEASKAPKRSKPGPKCSKKATDYDGLSSEEDNKASEHDYDDEDDDDNDLPPVRFFLEETDPQEEKDMEEDDENEMAKNGLLEDIKDEDEEEEEEDDKDDDQSSSEEDSEVSKSKSKKKDSKKAEKIKVKKEEAEEKNGDSDENVGKRKQIRSKLLDTKLSDSDSDVGKPRKKKNESDNESFKDQDSSSGSSIESDLSDDDDDKDESEKDSEDVDDDDGESKPKKKGKKRRRRKKGKKGSDNNEEDEDGEGEKKKKGKGKRRRRIKKMSNSSDDGEENEDDDDPNSSKAGKRKQIRKVMSNKKLEDSTKAAAKAEEKRRKRISTKQREFNIETITDENNPMNCPITTKLVLEPGKEEGDEPIVQVNKSLVRKLKPHQVEAVQFMWDCMYESVKRSKKEIGAGCILAHCMGLGKTLSVISFVHTILSHEKVLKHRTCLVVSPLNTVLNWRNEWTMWLDEEDQLDVWELASCKQNAARADCLKEWQESGGIMIMGYEMYRNLTSGNRCKNKRQKKVFHETLVDPGPDLVVCDEGHILKNEASAISKAMNQMKTRRRVVLTGTPLQNNLNEYHCMLSFVKPNLLGTRKEFTNRFISPIQNGQCTDSTLRDVKLMKARAHVLHEMLAGCVQRRDYSALTKFLPPKQEYVISVRLTNIQIELYEKYLEMSGQGVDGVFTNKGARLFTDYQNLMKIWTHPWVLKLAEIRDEMKVKYDDEDSFIDDDDSEAERSFSSTSSSSEEEKAGGDSGGEGTSAGPSMKRGTRRTRAKARRQAGEDSDPEEVIAEWKSKTRNGKEEDDDAIMEEPDKSVTKEWWAPYVTEDDKLKLELSHKLVLLFEILRMCEEIGDKVLIFSQSILSLNIIESFLEVIDSKFQQECDNAEEDTEMNEKETFGKSWTKNLDYYRMDGTTSAQNRQMWAASFNDLDNYRARLFLISTRAGGLGINLVAANRVIIFDASWNPSHDVQSIFRVYRFGQTKPCYIYRFLAQGTMEEKIYERQVTKLSLSQRVVDEHQIERHFSANDLKELYNFRPDRWDDGTEKPTLALPKDPLLAEILTANKQCVVSFHEHDSLLENQVEQTLTEEEKKAAWEEYENEKKGIIVRGPGMERTASWPMMAAAQILSREQISATVQALRQQLPDVSEELFHMHVQQALRRQVQMKQEELRRMELLRMQEMNYLNMIKQQAEQAGLSHAQSLQAIQNMAPWMQMQRLRAMQNSMVMQQGMHPSSSMSLLGQALSNPAERLSNKPEEAIDLDDN